MATGSLDFEHTPHTDRTIYKRETMIRIGYWTLLPQHNASIYENNWYIIFETIFNQKIEQNHHNKYCEVFYFNISLKEKVLFIYWRKLL